MALITCGECGKQISDLAAACPQCGAPGPTATGNLVLAAPKTKGFPYLAIVVSVVFAFIVMVWLAAPPASSDRSTDSANIRLDDDMRRDIGEAIRAEGYNCAEAKLARDKGPDAYGKVMHVWCGPPGKHSGVYPDVSFRVTFQPSGNVTIVPWD